MGLHTDITTKQKQTTFWSSALRLAEGTGFEGHNGVGTSQGYLWSATTGVAYLYLLSLQPTSKNQTLSAWNANARRVLLLIVSYGCLHTERNTINKKSDLIRSLVIPIKRRALDSNQRIPYDIGSLANCWFKPLTQPSVVIDLNYSLSLRAYKSSLFSDNCKIKCK